MEVLNRLVTVRLTPVVGDIEEEMQANFPAMRAAAVRLSQRVLAGNTDGRSFDRH